MLLLTHLIMPITNVITQIIFMVLFTSRSLHTWRKPLDALSGISPRYLSATYSQLTTSLFFCRHHMMTDYAFFSQGLEQVGEGPCPIVGVPYHLPPLQQSHISSLTQLELSPLTRPKAWGRNRESITISPSSWY